MLSVLLAQGYRVFGNGRGGSKQFSRNRFQELLIGNIKICMSRHQEKPLLPILELPDQPKNKRKGNKNKVYSLSEKHSKQR